MLNTHTKNTAPLISIVAPCYNHERFVEETLRSFMQQTYANIELIIINDGSTDRSEFVIRSITSELETRFERFVFVNKKNEGICSALNEGIMLSRGDYVLPFATDDVTEPEMLEQLIARIEQEDASTALVCAEADYINAEGSQIYPREDGSFSSQPVPGIPSEFTAFHLRHRVGFNLEKDFGSYVSILQGNYLPVGVLIRRAALTRVGLYDPQVRPDDWQMWFKLAKLYRMVFVPRKLVHYRRHGGNLTILGRPELNLDSFRLVASQYEYCRSNGLTREWYRAIASWLSLRHPRSAMEILREISVDPIFLTRGLFEAKVRSLEIRARSWRRSLFTAA